MWAVFTSIVYVLLAAGTFWAWRTLVRRSGQPQWWLAFGVAPLVTLLITYIVAPYQRLGGINGGSVFNTPSKTTDYIMTDVTAFLSTHHFIISQFGALNTVVALDMIAVVGAWVAFVVLVLTQWTGASIPQAPEVSAAAASAPASSPMTPAATRGVAPRSAPARAATPTYSPPAPPAGVPGGVDMRRRLYCPWCGEHIPGNRALGHDCGPKDRPEVICRFCGQEFPQGTTVCPTCDA